MRRARKFLLTPSGVPNSNDAVTHRYAFFIEAANRFRPLSQSGRAWPQSCLTANHMSTPNPAFQVNARNKASGSVSPHPTNRLSLDAGHRDQGLDPTTMLFRTSRYQS